MHEYPIIIFTALLIFVFGLFSRLSERSPITAPMVFVAVGMTISPYGIDFLKAGINVESGLNDGIALPPILVCITGLSAVATEQASVHY